MLISASSFFFFFSDKLNISYEFENSVFQSGLTLRCAYDVDNNQDLGMVINMSS